METNTYADATGEAKSRTYSFTCRITPPPRCPACGTPLNGPNTRFRWAIAFCVQHAGLRDARRKGQPFMHGLDAQYVFNALKLRRPNLPLRNERGLTFFCPKDEQRHTIRDEIKRLFGDEWQRYEPSPHVRR